ncbi:hypothetical protein LCGC14_0358970 [marine sediment metagenome]|uniref:Uncharacterized protein n=1 Tax=marine sediment metagenome TaxID=412755 RepID=A0A0F9TRP1_9ZZZZ
MTNLDLIKAAAEAKNGLLPCPFCRGEGKLNPYETAVHCLDCGAHPGYMGTKAEAITAWNKRAVDVPALCEALEVALKAIDNVPISEYGKAQDDGCDGVGAWDCFLETLNEWEIETEARIDKILEPK